MTSIRGPVAATHPQPTREPAVISSHKLNAQSQLLVTIEGKTFNLGQAKDYKVVEGGRFVLMKDGNSSGFEAEGEDLFLFNAGTKKRIKLEQRDDMVYLENTAFTKVGGTRAVLMDSADGGLGRQTFTLINTQRGVVMRETGAQFKLLPGGKAELTYWPDQYWDATEQEKAQMKPTKTVTIDLAKKLAGPVLPAIKLTYM
jgi:hypothetical protein